MQEDNYVGVLLENIQDQNKAVLEAVGAMRQEIKTLARQEDLQEVKQDVKTIRLAVKQTNEQVHDNDQRITRLEATA